MRAPIALLCFGSACLLGLAAHAASGAVVGSFEVSDGPLAEEEDPPTYSCVEACALLFGGATGDYFCSTNDATIDHQGFVDGLSDLDSCEAPVSETFKAGTNYNCGTPGCSYSAYVFDHACDVTNFCWNSFCGNGSLDFGEDCDDGNVADGDCCSPACLFEADGASCADADACNGLEQCDGAGTCDPGVAPVCDDGNACTQDSCDTALGCVAEGAPAAVCDASAGLATLAIDRAKQKLSWSASKATVQLAAFGNPLAADDTTLCIYDGASQIVRSLDVEGGGTCGTKPCWKATGSAGFAFKDKAGAQDGVRAMKLKASAVGKAKLTLSASGAGLGDIELGAGLASPVVTQVVNTAGGCFEASFEAAEQKVNDGAKFKAKHRASAP